MRHCRVSIDEVSAGTGTSGTGCSRRRKKKNNRRRNALQIRSPKHRSEKREEKKIASTQGEGRKLAGDGGAVLLVGWRGRRKRRQKCGRSIFLFFFFFPTPSPPPPRQGFRPKVASAKAKSPQRHAKGLANPWAWDGMAIGARASLANHRVSLSKP